MTLRLHIRLRQLRNAKRLSQQHLADRIGVPRGTYTHYELGRRTPDLELLMTIASLHHVSLDYLVGYTDRMPTPADWAQDHPDQAVSCLAKPLYPLASRQAENAQGERVAESRPGRRHCSSATQTSDRQDHQQD